MLLQRFPVGGRTPCPPSAGICWPPAPFGAGGDVPIWNAPPPAPKGAGGGHHLVRCLGHPRRTPRALQLRGGARGEALKSPEHVQLYVPTMLEAPTDRRGPHRPPPQTPPPSFGSEGRLQNRRPPLKGGGACAWWCLCVWGGVLVGGTRNTAPCRSFAAARGYLSTSPNTIS